MPVTHERSYEPTPDSIRAARRFVEDLLADLHADRESVEAARVVTSELATNAVIHAGTGFVLTFSAGPTLCIKVSDGDPTFPVRRPADIGRIGGRGLTLLDGLADEWGSTPTPAGKCVWAVLPFRTTNG